MFPHQNPVCISFVPYHIPCPLVLPHLASVKCAANLIPIQQTLLCYSYDTGRLMLRIQVFWDVMLSRHCKQSEKAFCTAGPLQMKLINTLKCHNHSVSNTALHPRRCQSSVTGLWDPKISRWKSVKRKIN
jgi:hypothetical protein